jgi:hypothetical protein
MFDPLKYGAVKVTTPTTTKKIIPQQQTSTQSKESLAEKVAGFAGVKNISKAIAYAISPEVRQYEKESIGKLPSAKEIAGDILQVGATLATGGIGGAGVKGALGVAKLAGKVGAAGAVSGFGTGLSENKSTADSLKQAFTTGLASAATVGVLSAAGKGAKLALEKLPERLYRSATKLESESAKALLDAKKFGTLGQIKGYVERTGAELDKTITAKITAKNGTINSDKFLKTIVGKIKSEWKGVSSAKIKSALKNADIEPFLKDKEVDFLTADSIRRKLGGTSTWSEKTKFGESVKETIWKEIVNTIRPATGTTKEFAQWAPLVQANKVLKKTIQNQSKRVVGLTDILVGTGVGVGGGILPGVASVAAKKAVESPLVMTGTAVGLNELNNLISKLPTDKAGKISRVALINLFKENQ